MKKLLLFLLFGCAMWVSMAQNIPNRGFEEWTIDTVYENTSLWTSVYSEQFFLGLDVLQRSTDAQDGNYSVYLRNDTIWNEGEGRLDSLFSYVLHGSVVNDTFSGISYTAPVDSITGWFKAEMGVGDSALVVVILFSATDTAWNVYSIGGSHPAWERFAYPLQQTAGTQTEAFIGLISSNPGFIDSSIFDPTSWIMFDNIAFTHATGTPPAIPDHSFEQWDVWTAEDPTHWHSVNWISAITGDDASVRLTTDAYRGNYAVKIISTHQSSFDDTIGVAALSPIGDNLPGGFAFDEVPHTIKGHYKYLPISAGDSALIAVWLTKWDPVGDSTALVKENYFVLAPQANYTSFSFTLDTAGVTLADFDSVNIILVSSMYVFSGTAPIGSELYVDELWLDSKCAYADTTSLFSMELDTIYASDVPAVYEVDDVWQMYAWSGGDILDSTSTNSIQTFNSAMYTLMVSGVDGCEIVDSIYLEVIVVGAVSDQNGASVRIYPNPTTEKVVVDFALIDASLQKEISIYTLSGNQILTTFVQDQNEVLNFSELPSGVYLMNIRIGEELTTVKVVKK